MKPETLEGLLADELNDIYSAENQVLKAFPKMIEAVESNDLHRAFTTCLEETHNHIEQIKEICAQLDFELTDVKCVGMSGIVEESKNVLKSGIGPDLLNVSLIGVVQRIEHYAMAYYGTARAHARQLGLINIANLLGQSLDEKRKADQRLTDLAQNRINVQAAMHHGSMVM